MWAGFCGWSLPAIPAWCPPLSPDQSVPSALLAARPLLEMVVPDHCLRWSLPTSQASPFPSPSRGSCSPWGCRQPCGGVALFSGVWGNPSSWGSREPPSVADSRPAATPFALYHGLSIRPLTDLVVMVCRLPSVGPAGSSLRFVVCQVQTTVVRLLERNPCRVWGRPPLAVVPVWRESTRGRLTEWVSHIRRLPFNPAELSVQRVADISRALWDYRQATFTQRLYARPRDGGVPEGIPARKRSALTTHLWATAALARGRLSRHRSGSPSDAPRGESSSRRGRELTTPQSSGDAATQAGPTALAWIVERWGSHASGSPGG